MEKFITAVVDTPDEADFIRRRFHENGIRFSRFDVDPTHEPIHSDDVGVLINPYNAIFSNNIAENWGSLAGANMGKFGGFLYTRATGETSGLSADWAGADADVPVSKEVQIRILVNEEDVDKAVKVLTNSHASHIRRA